MPPSYIERVMLANQYKILSLLEPDRADEHDHVREALEHGFESDYMAAFQNTVYEDALTRDETILVIDAMDLYWGLQRSYAALDDADKEQIDENLLDFPGFDGNNEGKLYAYANFIVDKERRFTALRLAKTRQPASESSGDATVDGLNSHMPMAEIYRNRIARCRPHTERRYQLSTEQILEILQIR